MLTKRSKLFVFVFLYLYKYKINKRAYWVHPYNKKRDERGYFSSVCEDIAKYPDR